MKKLFYLLALVAGSLAFTSCDDFQDEHNEFPWKPSATKLNTSDSRVGRMCTANGVITDNNAEAEGIIFAVDGNTAYLCAFTDLLVADEPIGREYYWILKATAWSSTYDTLPIGTGKYDANGNEQTEITDGEILTDMIVADTTLKSSAAKDCRAYFRQHYYTDQNAHAADTAFKASQGEWYLPSAQELEALVKSKNKINDIYLDGHVLSDSIIPTTHFTAIGGGRGYAYWSSTEFNASTAWYRIVNDNSISYLLKTIADGGTFVSKMCVRPIRKVTLQ